MGKYLQMICSRPKFSRMYEWLPQISDKSRKMIGRLQWFQIAYASSTHVSDQKIELVLIEMDSKYILILYAPATIFSVQKLNFIKLQKFEAVLSIMWLVLGLFVLFFNDLYAISSLSNDNLNL